jgi:hypothetical protein
LSAFGPEAEQDKWGASTSKFSHKRTERSTYKPSAAVAERSALAELDLD